ncbi:hypothetical protein [Streptomyces sp. t99]|uniref:hypothetical protein n=1 Tax=Streptomyces sp. t99 TaxID=1828172 RepID=UPI0035A08C29
MACVQSLGSWYAEPVLERGLEAEAPVGSVVGVEVEDRGVGERLNPGTVVESLGEDFARGAVLLQLQHADDALGVDGEQIDPATVRRVHLAADHEQRLAENVRV